MTKQGYLVQYFRDDAAPLSDGNTSIGGAIVCDSEPEARTESERLVAAGWTTRIGPTEYEIPEPFRVILHTRGEAPRVVSVSLLNDAALLMTDWRDRNGYGASDMGAKHGRVYQRGRLVARVSYNGKIVPCSK